MTCGNGTVEGTETCDDGNTNACGTCSADCATERTPAAATGNITTIPVAMLADGETFTLDDGISAATVFELDDDSSVAGGNVDVDISSAANANDVRDAIIAAVNGVAGGLRITASSGGAAAVDLVNDVVGEAGNQTIVETVADSGFTVTGMSGGAARDCAAGVGCVGNSDCTSGTCTSGTCE
jgi:cysteine-rich repeat protein